MSSGEPRKNAPKPLQGLRVLDFTTVLAGPYCTYQLALLGAEVIKVERPGSGDWTRLHEPIKGVDGLSAQFVAQNADKKSVTLNLQTERGRELALALIKESDILVENFAPGVADRLGIGFEAARACKPDLIYCAISGYGQDGPMSRRPAYDHVIQAMSGITMLTGTEETVPNRIGPPMFDYIAGMYGAFAVMAGLRERDRTGQAQFLDVAMLDASIVSMASTVSKVKNGGLSPRANGNTAASGSPASGIFPTRSGLLSITANQDAQMARLCEVLGIGELLRDARFATHESRVRNVSEFQQKLKAALLERDAAQWETLMSDAHLPASRVRTLEETLGEEHLQSRAVQSSVKDPVSGKEIHVPSIGFKWNRCSVAPGTAPPRLGEHTREVLQGLGLDNEALVRLGEAGVV